MVITHNMKNKKLLLGIAWAWLTCMSANAEVKLPAFFSWIKAHCQCNHVCTENTKLCGSTNQHQFRI